MQIDRCGVMKARFHPGGGTTFVCDREPGHKGSHRSYDEAHDEVVFWPATLIKPVRVEWLKTFAAHLRDRASFNGCFGDAHDANCVTGEPDIEKWCDYCRLGEAAVQIELLLADAEAGSAKS